MSETMQASVIEAYGEPEVLQLKEVEKPVAGAEEVLVRVRAAGVNPVDVKTRAGKGVAGRLKGFPVILGWDISGVVEDVGPGVASFAVGDEVYGMVRFPEEGRAYAQYVAAPAGDLAVKPQSLTHVEAAAVPLVALTSWQALFDAAGLEPGQRVLIHAAAGGVGHVAVQLARWKGAHVVGTASAAKADFVHGLGAHEVVDYTAGPFEERMAPVDVVLDSLAGEVQERSLTVLKPGGILVSIVGLTADEARAKNLGVRMTRIMVHTGTDQLARISRLIDAGELRPVVAATFPLAAAAAAHRASETHHTAGKIVLEVP
jgi:NADPH:quinone reductase-like Zn-dependent oxidoreductase